MKNPKKGEDFFKRMEKDKEQRNLKEKQLNDVR